MSLVDRAKNILLKPAAEWEVIAKEPASVGSLMTGYALPLGGIAAAIGIVAAVVFGAALASMLGGAAGALGTGAAIVSGVVSFALSMALVLGMCHITSALAGSFDGQADAAQAGKLIVYSGTAVWVAGFLAIIPVVGALVGLAGLCYACYLIVIGVRPVLGVPQEKVATASIVIILVYFLGAIIVGVINFFVSTAGLLAGSAAMSGAGL
jgi:hypothetical protein